MKARTFGDIISRVFAHTHATIGQILDHFFGSQFLERLADGHLTDAQLVGDALLPQPFSRLELATKYSLTQPIFYPVAYQLGCCRVVLIHSSVREM